MLSQLALQEWLLLASAESSNRQGFSWLVEGEGH